MIDPIKDYIVKNGIEGVSYCIIDKYFDINDNEIPFSKSKLAGIKRRITNEERTRTIAEDITKIEALYASQRLALVKRTSSTDGVRLRRATNVGMEAQQSAYALYQAAISTGVLPVSLTDAQKQGMLITISFDALLIKVCDKLSTMALNGEDFSELFTKAEEIKLEPSDVTPQTLTRLYQEFGIEQTD